MHSLEYNGSNEVNEAFYPKATASQRKIRGYQIQFPEADQVKACKGTYDVNKKSYETFLSEMSLHANITYKKDVEVQDLKMHRYELDKNLLDVDNVFVFNKGLIDVTNIRQSIPAYMSLPRFLGGSPELGQHLILAPAEPEKHDSFVSSSLVLLGTNLMKSVVCRAFKSKLEKLQFKTELNTLFF